MGAMNKTPSPSSLFAWSQTRITSGLGAIFNATAPLFTVIAAHLFTKDERLTPRKVVGVVAGISGVSLIIGPGVLAGPRGSILGEIACLLAALCYSLAAIYSRRLPAIPSIVQEESVPGAFTAANELVAWKADVLFAFGTELALQAAAAARPPVPIVMGAANFDPIAKGFVQSLARPGGNVTGIILRWPELVVKQIELLQEAFPDRNRLGVLWDTQSADQFSAAEHEAKARRLALRPLKLEKPPYDFAAAFRTLAQDDVQMLIVLSSPLFSLQNAQIASLAIEHRLPAMFILKHFVEAAGLMSYGVDFAPLMRRAASFVAKILRGAKAADLPVEQATHFEFVLNLKTAKAMGLTLLTSTLLRADEVIE